jgi:phage recombination protein Bet
MEKPKLIQRFAERFSVDPNKLFDTLKATAFKQRDGSAPTNEQMMALLVVADQYGLNPFTKEIFAFPDKQAGIIPVVGVDGWSRIINQHDQFDGMEFKTSENKVSLDGANARNGWNASSIGATVRTQSKSLNTWMKSIDRLLKVTAKMALTV